MNTKIITASIIGILVISLGVFSYYYFDNEEDQQVEEYKYNVTAFAWDLEAMNTYPQEILEIYAQDSYLNVDFLVRKDPNRAKYGIELKEYDYSVNVSKFLLPSEKIESDSSTVQELADSIAPGETDILKIVEATANWTFTHITFDEELASEIWYGTNDTQSAVDTIQKLTGTCSEYTNVFISVMRNKGIPAKFISGKMYQGGYHAWAEIYLFGVGWLPVDPQVNKVNEISRYFKLFAGVDFVDIDVKLADIKADLTLLDS